MAGITLYDITIPTFTKGLKAFDHILTKAEAYAKEKGFDVDTFFPEARLVDDQLPFAFQVQNATKAVQIAINRLTDSKTALFENNEKTIEDLHKRIQATLDLLKEADAKTVNGRQDVQVELLWAGTTHKVSVKKGVQDQNIPNFFFHLSTGYAILRAKGVPIGKADYLSSFLDL